MTNYVFFADGFEEIEALTTVDVLRRAGMDVCTVSINDGLVVTGAHNVTINADVHLDNVALADAQWLILPGGMPGATNLRQCGPLCDMLKRHHSAGRPIAAICASPTVVLATLGLLNGRKATCYPSMENFDCGVSWADDMVVVDGNIVTGRGPAAATEFALTIVSLSQGENVRDEVAAGMLL